MNAQTVGDVLRSFFRGEPHPSQKEVLAALRVADVKFGDGYGGDVATIKLDAGWGHTITVQVTS